MSQLKKILIIDDEEQIHLSVGIIIERLGYEPVSAYDGEEAYRIILDYYTNKSLFELIICDIHMIKMDGDELIRLLYERGIKIPIIVITGTGDKEKVVSLLRLGIKDFLDKPFSKDELEERMVYQLEKNRVDQDEIKNNETLIRIGEVARASFHDINNVMGGMQMFIEMLLKDLSEADPIYQKITSLLKANKRAIDICFDLLNMDSFSNSGSFAKVDLNEVVNKVSEAIKSILPETVKLTCETSPLPLWCNINVWQIKHMLLNLAFNAKDAMPDGGELHISVESIDSDVIISVKDSGAGIEPSSAKLLFEDGFSTKSTGHGIGLANVKKIIDEHNGTIKVDSELGNGTSFTITLPRNHTHQPC